MLYREPKLLKADGVQSAASGLAVSVLYREPKLLKDKTIKRIKRLLACVSVLYREPKLLKALAPWS